MIFGKNKLRGRLLLLIFGSSMAMTLWIFGVSASARFLLWAQRVRDDAQTGRPKTIRPALAVANIGAQPGFVVINAFLRTKALKRSPVPHEAELAMAVSAVIFHNFLSESHSRPFCALKKTPSVYPHLEPPSLGRLGPRFNKKVACSNLRDF
jgi:hypothetical protein